jgi:hypothetical protein
MLVVTEGPVSVLVVPVFFESLGDLCGAVEFLAGHGESLPLDGAGRTGDGVSEPVDRRSVDDGGDGERSGHGFGPLWGAGFSRSGLLETVTVLRPLHLGHGITAPVLGSMVGIPSSCVLVE